MRLSRFLIKAGTPPSGPSGTVDVTLEDFTSTAAGQVVVSGNLAETLDAFSSTATGKVIIAGSLAETLDDFTSTADGQVVVAGSLAETLEDFTATATGTVGNVVSGSLAETLEDFASTASGRVIIAGTLAETLADFTATAAGKVIIAGSLAETLEDFTSTASGTVPGAVLGSEYKNAIRQFPTGSTVTITVFDPVTGATVGVTSNACVEIGSTGTFIWSGDNIISPETGPYEYGYRMTDGTTTKAGRILIPATAGRGILRPIY